MKGLLKDYTLPGILYKLDIIECFEQPGKSLRNESNIISRISKFENKPRMNTDKHGWFKSVSIRVHQWFFNGKLINRAIPDQKI